ncbi:hypothetical protein ABIB87_005195 [Bradyrhizobium sp. JR18.2]
MSSTFPVPFTVVPPMSAYKNQQLNSLIILGWKAAGLPSKVGG